MQIEGIDLVPQQKRDDCFSACVSMLTGIPLDALPVLGPESYHPKLHSEAAPLAEKIKIRLFWMDVLDGWKVDPYLSGWLPFFHDNGYEAKVWTFRPPGPSIAFVATPWSGHAVIRINNYVINPAGGGEIAPIQEFTEKTGYVEICWITIREKKWT